LRLLNVHHFSRLSNSYLNEILKNVYSDADVRSVCISLAVCNGVYIRYKIKMHYRRLGKTNLCVSVIGIGTWQFGGEWGKNFEQIEVDRMFKVAHSVGCNLIDTAECYGDHTSEAFVGAAIETNRADWIVATKFGHKFHGPFNRTDERSATDAIGQVELSLRALKTDYIDLLQYHSVRDDEYDNDELSETLQKLIKSGKVRHLGASISPSNNIHQTSEATHRDVQTIQVVYNRLERDAEEQVLPSCQIQDLGVLARVPLASGYLSGKYRPGATFNKDDMRGKWHKQEDIDRKLAEVEKIREQELPTGAVMSQWALAWCLLHPAVTSVIPGCKDAEQVLANAAAADFPTVDPNHPQAWR
jgi:myo-inositol catabolism protein IolS